MLGPSQYTIKLFENPPRGPYHPVTDCYHSTFVEIAFLSARNPHLPAVYFHDPDCNPRWIGWIKCRDIATEIPYTISTLCGCRFEDDGSGRIMQISAPRLKEITS